MSPVISVIIPLYNRREYVKECIDSVLKQSIQDIEIICVDDGSTDDTCDTVREMQSYDTRIVLFEKRHEGAGTARNYGIKKARGEYVSFLDSDDVYLDRNALEEMVNCAKKFNLPVCGTICQYINVEGKKSHSAYNDYGLIPEDGLLIKYRNIQSFTGFTGFIFNKSFLLEQKIFFPKYLKFEDPPFLVRALSKAEIYYVLPIELYGIRRGQHDIQHAERYISDELTGILDVLHFSLERNYKRLSMKLVKYLYSKFNTIIPQMTSKEFSILCEIGRLTEKYNDGRLNVISQLREWIWEGYNSWEGRDYPVGMAVLKEALAHNPDCVGEYFEKKNYKRIILYGLGQYGHAVYKLLKNSSVEIVGGIDQRVRYFHGISIISNEEKISECDVIVITPIHHKGIKEKLKENTSIPSIYIMDIIKEIQNEYYGG